MPGALKKKLYTFDDFCVLVKDGEKADLLNGVIYMASPESWDGNRLFLWLASLLDEYVERRQLGEVVGSRVAFRLEGVSGPEPDIAFVLAARLSRKRRGYFDGPPDAAFEIVSADSIERDYYSKKTTYESHGVAEYWIIDDLKEKVILLRRGANGKYREVRSKKGALHSEVIAGFWLKPDWLWEQPRRPRSEVLQEILKSRD